MKKNLKNQKRKRNLQVLDRSNEKLSFAPEDRFYSAPSEDVTVIDDEKQILRLSVSSEHPVRRYDYIADRMFYEILSHNPEDIDLSRFENAAAWRDEHYGDQLGVISKPTIENKKLYVEVEFSRDNERAVTVYKDIKNGIRRNVSVRPEYTGAPKQDIKKIDNLRVMRFPWRPVHGATVADPADPTVGAGRNQQSQNVTLEYKINQSKKEGLMDPELRAFLESIGLDRSASEDQATAFLSTPEAQVKLAANIKAATRNLTLTPALASAPPNVQINESDIVAAERSRITEITAMGADFGMAEESDRAIADNVPAEAFRKAVTDKLTADRKITPVKKQNTQLGLSNRDLSQYSITRAVNTLILDKPLEGLERECSDEVAKQTSRSAKGFFIPSDVMFAAAPSRGQTVADPAAGGNLVNTSLLIGSMVKELHDAMVLTQMGVQTLHGLIGDVAIPTDDGGLAGYWLDENGQPSESEFKIGQVGMTPHTVGALVNLSRRLLVQTGSWVEGFVRRKIMKTLGLMIQQAALAGTGAKGQPMGLSKLIPFGNIVAIGANGDVPTYKHIVDLETRISDENADFGTLNYLTNSAMRGQLKITEQFTGTDGHPVWGKGKNGVGEMNGYNAFRTNQVPRDLEKGGSDDCSAIYFGNFAAMVIGFWTGVDITIDRATEAKTGAVNVIALQDCDIKLERKKSFSMIKDARVE